MVVRPSDAAALPLHLTDDSGKIGVDLLLPRTGDQGRTVFCAENYVDEDV